MAAATCLWGAPVMTSTQQKVVSSVSLVASPATGTNQHSYPDRAPKGTCSHAGLRLQSVPEFSVSVWWQQKNTDVATSCLPIAWAAGEWTHCLCSLQRWRWQVYSCCQWLAEVCNGMEPTEGAVLLGFPETSCLHRRGSPDSCWRWFLPEIWTSSFLMQSARVEKQKRKRKVKRNSCMWTPRI